MQAVADRVRWTALPLACLLAFGSRASAQVAIQVKSGTVWTSNIELKAIALLTFRWRWDGAETPTSVAWQLATVTPTSTATTRATDVIASETGMRLAKAGVYEEFTVTPASTWPAKFYVRVRVNVGKKSVYSRWASVSVVPVKESFVANPSCAFKAWHTRTTYWGQYVMNYDSTAISQGDTAKYSGWDKAWVHILAKNARGTEARYRQNIVVMRNGVNQKAVLLSGYLTPEELDPTTIRSIGGGKTDTVTLGLRRPSGEDQYFEKNGDWTPNMFEITVYLMPLDGVSSKCGLRFYVQVSQ